MILSKISSKIFNIKSLNHQSIRFSSRYNGKFTSVEDAVSLVRDNDTLFMSGFVCQGIPEALMRALGERYLQEGHPKDITLMFYGAGDPAGKRGTNHLKHPGLLKRIISSHFGQSPDLHSLIAENKIEAYALPMGSVCRMVRSKASGSPGHLTRIGLGTFVDPRNGGGKLNSKTTADLVDIVNLDGMEYLRFKPITINHAFIRATTGDADGNLSVERESVLTDIRLAATATRACGGLVSAQVARVAAQGSITTDNVAVPGAMVDCVVQAAEEDNHMSFYTKYNPGWSGEIKVPMDSLQPLSLDVRKIIARRATMELKTDHIVNLGIGMPEGVASVAAEENILQHIILTTEAGVHGGIGASGADFGPAINPTARVNINEQFDFYDGGGLSICFLGAGECDENGNVNVSKLQEGKFVGPGGFVDITQSTKRVMFMGTFTKKGLKIKARDGKLEIVNEGQVSMFPKSVKEITFNAAQATLNGQKVKYVTERAVFELCNGGLTLTEVAPGIDVQTQILDLMHFRPLIVANSLEDIPKMDSRIFCESKMHLQKQFELLASDRLHYDKARNTVFMDLSYLEVKTVAEMKEFFSEVDAYLDKITNDGNNKIHCVVNYAGFKMSQDLMLHELGKIASYFEERYYLSVKRLCGKAFRMNKYFKNVSLLTSEELWDLYREDQALVTRSRFRHRTRNIYQMRITDRDVSAIFGDKQSIETFEEFEEILDKFLDYFSLDHLR